MDITELGQLDDVSSSDLVMLIEAGKVPDPIVAALLRNGRLREAFAAEAPATPAPEQHDVRPLRRLTRDQRQAALKLANAEEE